jgi:heme/copper-type cytochrome/quinol oxidase subunit 4
MSDAHRHSGRSPFLFFLLVFALSVIVTGIAVLVTLT